MRAGGALLLWCIAGVCHAETEVAEAVVAGVNLQRMESADGGSIGADWIRTTEKRVYTAGAGTTNIGTSQWTVVRATAAQIRGTRPAVSGSVEVGPGSDGAERFTYSKLGVGFSASLAERWRLFARDTYVDIEPVAGHILELGVEATRRNGLSLQVQASRSVSGSLYEHGQLVRVDYRARPPYFMGGVSVTTTNERIALGGAQTETSVTKVRQTFFGVSFPVRGKELTIAAELGYVGGARRGGLSVFVRSSMGERE